MELKLQRAIDESSNVAELLEGDPKLLEWIQRPLFSGSVTDGPLVYASRQMDVSYLEQLLQAGASPNAVVVDKDSRAQTLVTTCIM